jgi:DNA-binding IclR family transcriptional regulator
MKPINSMNKNYTVPSLKNSFAILEVLSNKNEITLQEISRTTAIPKTTVFRILYTLEQEGVIERQSDKFKIGFRVIKLGMAALSKMELRNVAIPFLYELSYKLGETSHLAVLADRKSLIIEVCDSPHPVKISSRPGTAVSLHCSATGKVFLAFAIGAETIEEYLKHAKLEKRTGNTFISLSELKREIQIIFSQGYAVDNEEYYENVRCLAAPVRNAFGKTVAAIGITATTFRFKPEMIESAAAEVIRAANEISKKLGA